MLWAPAELHLNVSPAANFPQVFIFYIQPEKQNTLNLVFPCPEQITLKNTKHASSDATRCLLLCFSSENRWIFYIWWWIHLEAWVTSPADFSDAIQPNIIMLSKASCVNSVGPSLPLSLLSVCVCVPLYMLHLVKTNYILLA